MGFTCDTMLDAILITNASKHTNHASMALGWFGANLVADPLLVAPLTFWPLQILGDETMVCIMAIRLAMRVRLLGIWVGGGHLRRIRAIFFLMRRTTPPTFVLCPLFCSIR